VMGFAKTWSAGKDTGAAPSLGVTQ